MSRPPQEKPPRWWQLPWRSILAFPVGVGILVWQTTVAERAQLVLVLAALALMGVVPAAVLRDYIRTKIGE